MATVTSKGQVTLPKQIRDALGIEPGSQVEFVLEDGRAILRKQAPVEAIERWEGRLRGRLPAATVEETMEMLRGRRPRGEAIEE